MSHDGERDESIVRNTAVMCVVVLIGCGIVLAAELAGGNGGVISSRIISRCVVIMLAAAGWLVHVITRERRRRGEKDLVERASSRPEAPTAPRRAGADLDGMLLRSDDVLATLRDVAEHGRDEDGFGELPLLLRRAGLLAWESAPEMGINKLRRNGRWWLEPRGVELSEGDLDRLFAVEAALNANEDLISESWAPGASVQDRLEEIFARVADLKPVRHDDDKIVPFLLEGAEKNGEWACRMALADFVENVPVPLPLDVAFQANLALGTLCADVMVPRPASLSVVAGDDPVSQARHAAAYALRVALLVARGAFDSSPVVSRVVVNCHGHGDGETVLSLDLDRGSLRRLVAAMRGTGTLAECLPEDAALRATVAEGGRLSTVEPFLRRSDEALNPRERYREVELDPSPTTDAVRRACGAARVCELGIMEKVERASAWNRIAHELGSTTQDAVSRLVSLRNETNDVTVAEACERASRALVEGTVDVSNRREIALLFVDGGALADAARHARRLAALEHPTPEQLTAVLEELEAVLSPIAEMGVYLDDGDSVYRYFNSAAERITYNRTVDDGGREVRLVPDEYYGAHSSAIYILNLLGRHEEALAHANELMRVAPRTPDAALAKVRCLEEQSRILEAADLLKDAIGFSSTARDMSICFYRLAFMEWRLGRSDLAVACYQRSMELNPQIAEQATQELSDLLESDEGLRRLRDEEVIPVLEAGGIPKGPVARLREELRDATVACTDAGIFSVARPLSGALLELTLDHALINVHRSLLKP